MIIYKKNSEELVIPVGLGPNVSPITGYELQMKRVDSSTEIQHVEPDSSYYGLYRVIVDPYELDSKTVDASTEAQVITSSKDGLFQVIVNPYTLESRNETVTENGTFTYSPSTANGLAQVTVDVSVDTVNNQSKTVDSSTTIQYVQPDDGYTGLDYVAVNPYTLESKSETITVSGQYTYTATDADGLSQVTVDVSINDSPELQSKTVDSSTTQQTVMADSSYDGLSQVIVEPYTLDSKTVDPSTVSQTVNSSADGLSSVTVNAVDASIDPDIQPENIKLGVEILGVTGTYAGQSINNQNKTVDSSTVSQSITADSSYTGLGTVTVNPYTLDIKTVNPSTNQQIITSDADGLSQVTVNAMNLQYVVYNDYEHSAQNWVFSPSTGYDGMSYVRVAKPYVKQVEVNSSTNQQVITPSDWYCDLFGKVTIYPYTTETDSSTLTANGTYTFTPQNAHALSQVTVDVSVAGQSVNNQNKTVDSSTVSQSVTADNGYTGLGTVTVNPYTTETDSSTLTANGQYVFTPQNADALSQVTVNVSVNSSSNTEWVIQARKGITTDASNISLTANRDLCYHSLCYGASGLVSLPHILDTSLSYMGAYDSAFAFCSNVTGNVTVPNLTEITANGGRAMADTFGSTNITSANFPSLQYVNAPNGLTFIFSNCMSLTDASFPNLISLEGDWVAEFMFTGCASLTNISFPSLETISGRSAASGMFTGCTSLTSVSFPSLETIYGLNAAQDMFKGCTSLTSVSFPELQFVDEPNDASVCNGMFDDCSAYDTLYVPKLDVSANPYESVTGICGGYDNIKTLTCKPSFATHQREYLQGLENLTLTGSITTDFDLQYSGILTPQSVLNVLQAIDTTQQTPGTVTFYTNGLTVTDYPDGRIQTAYDDASTAGWTILNLTINQSAPAYTPLEYITYGNTSDETKYLELPCTLTSDSVVQFTVNYQQAKGGLFLNTLVTDGYSEEWRVFAYGSSLYADLGGGINTSGGRYSVGPTFSAVNNKYGTIEVGVKSNYMTYQKDVSTGTTYTNYVATPFRNTSPYKLTYQGTDFTWLREVKIYLNGLNGGLTYDFVAAKDSNNVPGLYDTVNDVMYYSTSGTLTAGPVLS